MKNKPKHHIGQIDKIFHRLYTSAQRIRNTMPSWHSGKIQIIDTDGQVWARFRITVRPKGIRGICIIRTIFFFTTSQTPHFSVEAVRLFSRDTQPFRLTIDKESPDAPKGSEMPQSLISTSQDVYAIECRDDMIMRHGRYVYTTFVHFGYQSHPFEILSFDAKDIDTVIMWVVGCLGSAIIGALLTWWLG